MNSASIISRPLETAAQRAERRALTSQPGPQSKPVVPELFPEPLHADVLAQSDCNGGNHHQAQHAIRENAKSTLSRMKFIAPDAFAVAESARAAIVKETASFYAAIDGARTAIGALETALVSRGELLRTIATDESALADAKARLDSPDVLNTAPEFVLRLTHIAKFLPEKISADKAEARRLESEARSIIKEHGLDLDALVKRLLAESRNDEGRITNGQIVTLHTENLLAL